MIPVGAGGGGRLTASGASDAAVASCSNLDRKLLTGGILFSSILKGSMVLAVVVVVVRSTTLAAVVNSGQSCSCDYVNELIVLLHARSHSNLLSILPTRPKAQQHGHKTRHHRHIHRVNVTFLPKHAPRRHRQRAVGNRISPVREPWVRLVRIQVGPKQE